MWTVLLSAFGWQDALLCFAVLCSIMVASAAFMQGQIKQDIPANTVENNQDQTLREALSEAFRQPSYWLINAGFFVCVRHVYYTFTQLSSRSSVTH